MKTPLPKHASAARFALAFLLLLGALRADCVLAWNDALTRFSLSSPRPLDPLVEARAYALAHLAIDEAVRSSQRASRPVGDSALATAAVATAAETVLAEALPQGAPTFRQLAAAQLAALPAGGDKEAGAALGRTVGAAVLEKRREDRWGDFEVAHVRLAEGPAAQAAVLRDGPPPSPWTALRPFVLRQAGQIQARALHWVTIDGEILSVLSLSRARIFDEVDRRALDETSRFWTEPPLVCWNRLARDLSARAGDDPATSARLLAVLNLALADAALASVHWQFVYGSWRSERLAVTIVTPGAGPPTYDGTPVERVEQGVKHALLPPAPRYPAVPAALAGAAQAVLDRRFRETALALEPPHGRGVAGRSFASPRAAAREAAFAATLDGGHSREACVAGYDLGERVGEYVARRMR